MTQYQKSLSIVHYALIFLVSFFVDLLITRYAQEEIFKLSTFAFLILPNPDWITIPAIINKAITVTIKTTNVIPFSFLYMHIFPFLYISPLLF